MNCDCDLFGFILSGLWLVIGVAIAGPIGYFIGKNRRKREFTYKGLGGE
jgi:hypothetical protein